MARITKALRRWNLSENWGRIKGSDDAGHQHDTAHKPGLFNCQSALAWQIWSIQVDTALKIPKADEKHGKYIPHVPLGQRIWEKLRDRGQAVAAFIRVQGGLGGRSLRNTIRITAVPRQ